MVFRGEWQKSHMGEFNTYEIILVKEWGVYSKAVQSGISQVRIM